MANLFGRKGFLGLVSIALTLCLCVGMLVAIPTTVAAEGNVQVWDGSKPAYSTDLFANGDGTEGNPFLVTTAAQLYAITVSGDSSEGKYYELMNDIYLNGDYANYNSWSLGTNPTDSKGNALNLWSSSRNNIFKGKFNGNGYTVYGIAASGANAQGLFPAVASTVTIENLTVDSFYTVPWTRGGGVVGCVENGTLTLNNIVVKNGKMAGIQVKGSVGGIVGTNENTGIVNISNSAVYNIQYSDDNGNAGSSQIAHTGYGGIIGFPAQASTGSKNGFFETHAQRLSVKNSYSVDVTVEGENCYPIGIGIWGANTASVTATVNNVYTDTVMPTYDYNSLKYNLICSTDGKTAATENPIKIISTENIRGDAAKTAMPALDWALSWSTVENGYPIPENKVWDGTKPASLEAAKAAGLTGTGSVEDPYIISNGAQLYWATTSSFDGSEQNNNFELACDIYLNEDYLNYDSWKLKAGGSTDTNGKALNTWWDRNNSHATGDYWFRGNFNGNGYTVYGLCAGTTASPNAAGLFPNIRSGVHSIKNVNVANSASLVWNKGAALVGFVYTSTTVNISNCSVVDSKVVGMQNSGTAAALVATTSGFVKIENCFVDNFYIKADNTSTETTLPSMAFGAFIGGSQKLATANEYNAEAGERIKVKNSYAINSTYTELGSSQKKPLYPIGVYVNASGYSVGAVVNNVYTDVAQPTFDNGAIKLICSTDGINAAAENPIKLVGSDNMKGLLDSGAWYAGKLSEVSADNLPRLRSNITRFTYADINGDGIDAAYTAADIIPVREYLLGTVDYAYIDGDANASGKIDIRDLVNVYNAVK